MKDSNQLKEFELEEKINHLEDRIEWMKEDEFNRQAQTEELTKLVEKYEGLLKENNIEIPSHAQVKVTISQPMEQDKKVTRKQTLFELLAKQEELGKELRQLVMDLNVVEEAS